MNGRQRIEAMLAGRPVDRCGYWTGHPHPDSLPGLLAHFDCPDTEALYQRLGDDLRWMPLWWSPAYPPGLFADCQSPDDIERFAWPDPDTVDFSEQLRQLEAAEGYYRLGGNPAMFFHWDCFQVFGGMGGYFEKMYTHPAVVHAFTRRINDIYLRLNRRLFEQAHGNMEACKISHDLGTQTGLMMSPAMLEEFVFPYITEQIDLAHEFNLKLLLHCCGSIRPILDRLIALGVDLLHPIQALAAGMDAESLRPYRERLLFVGGIDVQRLLVHGTPRDIAVEVRRVARVLGPLVISPSHEAILPDVPPANVEALAQAVRELGGVG